MTNDRPAGVAIIGGGLAGLALAVAMAWAGTPCQVYEQATELAEVGAGIQLAPSATRLLNRFGLRSALQKDAVRPAAMEFRRWEDGSVISRTQLGDACEERYGAPYYALHRAHLHQALLDALEPGTVQLGRRCVALTEQADRVVLHFADGSSAVADAAVGADGIHSVLRGALVADVPRFSGQYVYRGLVDSRSVPFLLDEPKVLLYPGPGRHFVCYPVSGGELVNFVATVPAGEGTAESWFEHGRVQDVTAAYDGWSDEVTAVIGAARSVTRWAVHDRDPIDRWSTSRITLVGDSAHPMLPFLGQGANQAIEDATVLAMCLRRTTGADIPAALRRYEELRRDRTALVQERSRANGRALHLPDGAEQLARDIAMGRGSLEGQDWLYGYDAQREALGTTPSPAGTPRS
ncbi:FAD-dependent monooxygenase [Kitasatospora phosalacinea]|uniref:FAD-dependent monooxygenase n=1 Tax=Kitasatospora phosalacinea TaxID=2065 RepID=UPI00365D7EA7